MTRAGTTAWVVERMEDRILHSADLTPLTLGLDAGAGWHAAVQVHASADIEAARTEIAFVDMAVPDAQQLVDDLLAQRAAGRPIEVVRLETGSDGVAVITAALEGRSDVAAVHVLSHGQDGVLQLGNARLDETTLLRRAGEVSAWSSAFSADGDLLLYGCEVAQTSAGHAFVRDLAMLTGADVAASIDITGASALGGDWALEHASGRIDAGAALGAAAQQAWSGTLAVAFTSESSGGTNSATTSYNFSHNVNNGSDRLLLVELVIANGVDATAVNFNGNALTLLDRQDSPTGHVGVEVWYLVAPPVSSGSVEVTLASASTLVAGATSYSGVNQALPFDTPVKVAGNNWIPWTVMTADPGDLVVDIVGARQVSGNVIGLGQTQNFEQNQGTGANDLFGVSSREAGAATVVLSHWFAGVDGNWASIGVEINQVGTSVQITAAQDTYITSGSTVNYGASTSLVVDRSGGSALGNGRALLQFDLSAIPAGATITSATLQMQASANGGAFNIDVHALTEAWVEGNGGVNAANWTERTPGVNWTSAGGSFDPTPAATLNTGAVGQHSWNLTSLVQAWVAGSTVNHGIIIGSPDTGTTTITYDSSEGTTAPRLAIVYTVPNAAPTITSNGAGAGAAIEVDENTVAVTTVTATDADLPAQTISYSIAGGDDAASFAIDPVTGVLRFVTAPDFELRADFDADNVYDVIVRASDGTLEAQQAIAVTVSNVNDNAPVSASASASGPEDTLLAVNLSASDADNPVASFTVQVLPANGTLYLDAARTTAIVAGTAYAATANALTLYFSPATDWNGSAGFSFFATDDLGLSSAAAAASLTLTPVNDTPVAATASASGAEDTLLPVTLTAGDVDGTIASFSVQALPANGTLYLDAARTTAVIAGTAYAATANALTLYFSPAADWNGSTGFNFVATDNLGLNSELTAADLTLTPVNDTPVAATATASASGAEDTLLPVTLTAGDVDGTIASFTVQALPANGTLYLDAARATAVISGTAYAASGGALTLYFSPTADWSGSTGFDFFATDDLGLAGAVTTASLTVTPGNDAPTLVNPIADQGASQDSVFTFRVPAGTFGDVDAGTTLSYSATLASGAPLPAWLSFNAATRTFSGTPGNADVGTVTITVIATDTAGDKASDSFDIVVANANDAPTVAAPIADQAATEDLPFSFTFAGGTFADIDAGDTLSYTTGALPAWLSFNATTRTFSGTPGNADVGAITVRVTATDNSAASIFSDFVLTVANVNDAPTVGAPIADQAAAPGAVLRFAVPASTFADADAGDTLAIAASLADGTPLPGWLLFNAGTGAFTGTPTAADLGTLVVRLTASDATGASAQTAFMVIVAEPVVAPVPPAVPAPAPASAPVPHAPVPDAVVAPVPSAAAAPAAPAAPAASPAPPSPTPLPVAAPPVAEVLAQAALGPDAPAPATASAAGHNPVAPASTASRADAALAQALVPEFSEITLAPMLRLAGTEDLMRKFEELQRRLVEQGAEHKVVIASGLAVTGGLSVGYVVWLVRGGVLISSMLSALPAWQLLDPLPVVTAGTAASRKARGLATAGGGDDDDVERLFDSRTDSRTGARGAAARPHVAHESQARREPLPEPHATPTPATTSAAMPIKETS